MNTPSFPDFGKLVPGFDFLQNLSRQASASTSATPAASLPGLGGWVAPTLNVEELEKRIQELKAVQFWLDQNAAALKATIQALELQKMTLATLKGMNFNMAEIANAFTLKTGQDAAASTGSASGAGSKSRAFAGLEIPPSTFQAGKAQPAPSVAKPEAAAVVTAPAAPAAAGVVDPMQWWGALTQQFQAIASEAMKEVAKTTSLGASVGKAVSDPVKTATGAKGTAPAARKAASAAGRKTAR